MNPETTATQFGSSDRVKIETFESFLRRLTPELLAYFGRRVSPAEDAADCLGETLLVLWRRRDTLPTAPEGTPCMGRGHRQSHPEEPPTRASPQDRTHREAPRRIAHINPVRSHQHRFRAIDALAHLSHQDRELITIVVWEGFSLG